MVRKVRLGHYKSVIVEIISAVGFFSFSRVDGNTQLLVNLYLMRRWGTGFSNMQYFSVLAFECTRDATMRLQFFPDR